jgi:hypothetical protein
MKTGRPNARPAAITQARPATHQALVVVKDEIIIFCSQEFASSFGFSPEEMTGEPAGRFFNRGPVIEPARLAARGDIVAMFVVAGQNTGQMLFVESHDEGATRTMFLLSARTPVVAAAAEPGKQPAPASGDDSPVSINLVLDEVLATTWRSVEHPPAAIERDYGLLPAITAGRAGISSVLTRMIVLAERSLLSGGAVSVRTRSDGERAIVLVSCAHERTGTPVQAGAMHRKALEDMFGLAGDEECDRLLAPYGGVLALNDEGEYRATLTIPIHPKPAHDTVTRRRDMTTVQWTP